MQVRRQSETAKRLLKWPYCHDLTELGLPPGEAGPCLALILAADALSLNSLVLALQPALLGCLSPLSAPAILAAAQSIRGCKRLATTSVHYILKNFPACAASCSDIYPPFDLLEQCLQHLMDTRG